MPRAAPESPPTGPAQLWSAPAFARLRRMATTQPPSDGRKRCPWCTSHPLYMAYHDEEWGVPEHDDRALFEKLLLDGFQAGLSWFIILKKRDAFRRAFADFEPERVARFTPKKLARLRQDEGIVRNGAKIDASVASARAYLTLRDEGMRFSTYLWGFTGGRTIQYRRRRVREVPTETRESRAMAADLKRRGFKFCGPTICYAFMQAVGMVNDHLVDCHRYEEVAAWKSA
jgi:DNA-3-methyladenine glycosylase I